jgi:hypothetical protein
VVLEGQVKYAVSVLNIGGFINDKCRESMVHAADRWGAEYVEWTEDVVRSPHGCQWFNKFVQTERFSGYDGVIHLDGDIMVSIEAPSPFETAWDHKSLGYSCEYQPEAGIVGTYGLVYKCGFIKKCVDHWATKMGMSTPSLGQRSPSCVNGGVLMYNPALAAEWFAEVLEWGKIVQHGPFRLSDQSILSVLIENGRIPGQTLGITWNCTHAGNRPSLMGPGMCYNVYHFCGRPKERPRRYSQVDWRIRQ